MFILSVVKFMKKFEQQGIILNSQVNDLQTPLFLGLPTMSQDASELHLIPSSVFFLHKQCRLILYNWVTIFGGNLMVPIGNIISDVIKEFMRDSLPAYDITDMVVVMFLSALHTNGVMS